MDRLRLTSRTSRRAVLRSSDTAQEELEHRRHEGVRGVPRPPPPLDAAQHGEEQLGGSLGQRRAAALRPSPPGWCPPAPPAAAGAAAPTPAPRRGSACAPGGAAGRAGNGGRGNARGPRAPRQALEAREGRGGPRRRRLELAAELVHAVEDERGVEGPLAREVAVEGALPDAAAPRHLVHAHLVEVAAQEHRLGAAQDAVAQAGGAAGGPAAAEQGRGRVLIYGTDQSVFVTPRAQRARGRRGSSGSRRAPAPPRRPRGRACP